MICQNCNTEYLEEERTCPACGRSADIKTDFDFKMFWNNMLEFVRKQELSAFQKGMSIVSAVTLLIFFICNANANVASAPMSWLCPVAVFVMLTAVFCKYDAASIPMVVSYSIFLLPNLINIVKTFGYLRGANATFTLILCILLYGNLTILWLLATKVIKNTPVFKLIVAISSVLVGVYEIYYLFRMISVNFILALHAMGWIGFIGTQAIILIAYDKKRVFGIFNGLSTPQSNTNQPYYANIETPRQCNSTSTENTSAPEQIVTVTTEQISEQKFIFCSRCGQKLPIDSAFCEYCGSKINR